MKRCGECGSTTIVRKSAKGKIFAFKDHRQVPLLYDLQVLTCNFCGNTILSNKDISELNELLEKSIKDLAGYAIADIVSKNDLQQIDVAKMLGKTPQYISYLKAGSKIPSFSTLTLMRVFAKYPDVMEEFTGFKAQSWFLTAEPIEVFHIKEETAPQSWAATTHAYHAFIKGKEVSRGFQAAPRSEKPSNSELLYSQVGRAK